MGWIGLGVFPSQTRLFVADTPDDRFRGLRAMNSVRRHLHLQHAAGYIELGELLADADLPVPDHARKLFHRALAELQELPVKSRIGPVASLLEGRALRDLGGWEAALEPLKRAAESAPDQLEPWLGLGWCYKRLGRLSEAIAALRSGLEAAPGQPLLLYNLACYHSLAGDVAAAVDHLTRAISLDDRFRDLTGGERDFDPIREDPRFVAVTHVVV
jgi:tetratricopeptide (TPR) repeat protein